MGPEGGSESSSGQFLAWPGPIHWRRRRAVRVWGMDIFEADLVESPDFPRGVGGSMSPDGFAPADGSGARFPRIRTATVQHSLSVVSGGRRLTTAV